MKNPESKIQGAALSLMLRCITGLMLVTASAHAQGMMTTAQSYSGRATVVSATLAGQPPVVVADTGPLPGSGGALQASLLQESVPGLGSVEVCHAVTYGLGDTSYAEATVGRTNLTAGGTVVTADALSAWAMANCCTGASISGASQIANLNINGQPVTVTGQPNQTIPLPVGRIVINEQITALGADSGGITVNALHIVIDGVADIVVSSAHADISCGAATPPPPGSPCDFITGGGWITGTPSGAKGNFGVAGGTTDSGAFWGHLNYIDHGSGMHVKDTAVTGYQIDPTDPDCRLIDYAVTIDGAPGTARVRACDKGEPGVNDVFEITLSNGYHAAGNLGGGNIQLHKCDGG
ncbi:choice-of-anchor P family protein [Opitutus sp. GAS368]|uniref:choice-of-anchor P family protein n=1 Tax=Opitutus sp. GAS368 TaxID=1882749 RepID=UPI000B838085|nr:choice-of-anchor P family protein [Opitutus sp. GAS368]